MATCTLHRFRRTRRKVHGDEVRADHDVLASLVRPKLGAGLCVSACIGSTHVLPRDVCTHLASMLSDSILMLSDSIPVAASCDDNAQRKLPCPLRRPILRGPTARYPTQVCFPHASLRQFAVNLDFRTVRCSVHRSRPDLVLVPRRSDFPRPALAQRLCAKVATAEDV